MMTKWGNVTVHIILILVSLACLLPFLLVLSVSLTAESSLVVDGFRLIPKKWSLEAYEFIFRSPGEIISAYKTTTFITLFGTMAGTLIMTMLAYPLSRTDFKYKNAISFFVYFTMLFSGGVVSEYILIANFFQLRDTIWALILPLLLNAWNVMLLRMFLKSIPFSLIEAAYIEGAGELRIFFQIILPLGKIGIITISLFTALTFWNDWFLSMLYIDRGNIMSLQYMLYRIINKVELAKEQGAAIPFQEKLPNENLRMALCVVAAGPMVIVFMFFQKYFSKGIVAGSVKG